MKPPLPQFTDVVDHLQGQWNDLRIVHDYTAHPIAAVDLYEGREAWLRVAEQELLRRLGFTLTVQGLALLTTPVVTWSVVTTPDDDQGEPHRAQFDPRTDPTPNHHPTRSRVECSIAAYAVIPFAPADSGT